MTEQVKVEETTAETVEQPKQYSEIEQRAMSMGWRPKEEFDGEDDAFIEAKEFVGRASLYEKIDNQGRELKGVRDALNNFKNHYSTVRETEFNRAMATLRAERKVALKEGDADRFSELDDQLVDLQAEADKFKEEQKTQTTAPANPVFAAWTARETWYNTKPHMQVYADQVGTRLAQQGVPPEEVLKQVSKAVREEFPKHFENPARKQAGAVEGSTPRKGASASDEGGFELNDQERRIMNNLVSQGVLTKKQYIDDLKAAKARGR